MIRVIIDTLDWWALLPLIVLILLTSSELGFRLGRRHASEVASERKSQSGMLVTAMLALLGLILAFSFSIVESRFLTRKKLILEEANAIGTTYLRANMLPPPHDAKVRSLLRAYLDSRLGPQSAQALESALKQSEELHDKLWIQANAVAENHPRSVVVALFVLSLNEVIDLHQERVTVALYNRLPVPIVTIVFLVAVLSIAVSGYTAGLARTRTLWPTFATIVAVSAVMVLIFDLDSPWQRVFEINKQALLDTKKTMSKTY